MSSFAGSEVSNSEIARFFELEKRSCQGLFRKGQVRYQNATTMDGAEWANKVPLKGFSKVTPEIKEALDGWARDHPNVRPSPIMQH